MEENDNRHGLTEEDIKKMTSDATFFFLVANQKKSLVKVISS